MRKYRVKKGFQIRRSSLIHPLLPYFAIFYNASQIVKNRRIRAKFIGIRIEMKSTSQIEPIGGERICFSSFLPNIRVLQGIEVSGPISLTNPKIGHWLSMIKTKSLSLGAVD